LTLSVYPVVFRANVFVETFNFPQRMPALSVQKREQHPLIEEYKNSQADRVFDQFTNQIQSQKSKVKGRSP